MKIKKFNWLAIFAGAVACFFLGFLWYGVLFLDTWAAPFYAFRCNYVFEQLLWVQHIL